MIRQQHMLMATEGVDLEFTDAAIREIASMAAEVSIGRARMGTAGFGCGNSVSGVSSCICACLAMDFSGTYSELSLYQYVLSERHSLVCLVCL